jgi:hypothetical protein
MFSWVLIDFSFTQEPAEAIDTLRRDALKLFLDCSSCDEDYIRREIPFINYVRDRKEAQVHLMVTSERTGSGGREYTFHFLGQNEFEGQNDTLKYVSYTDDTEEIRREGQTDLMKLGLIRYVAKTPLAKRVNIQFAQPEEEELVEDKWRSWVFKNGLSGSFDGESSYSYQYISGSLSVSKVTPEWKMNFNMYYNVITNKFEIDDETLISTRRSKSFSSTIVKSLGEHWSIGGRYQLSSNTYSNYKLRFYLAPGIEYDIYPYSESTRKQLRILYSVGYAFHNYQDSTIYDKTKENLVGHNLEVAFEVTQKWGSVEGYLEWNNYFHDWSKNNLSLNTYLNMRIVKGLSFSVGGGASIVHDQLSLVKGGATTEEILLRRKQIETQYYLFTYLGITYTFGSIYSNVVNPRFGN